MMTRPVENSQLRDAIFSLYPLGTPPGHFEGARILMGLLFGAIADDTTGGLEVAAMLRAPKGSVAIL
jgi:hypothetical protein